MLFHPLKFFKTVDRLHLVHKETVSELNIQENIVFINRWSNKSPDSPRSFGRSMTYFYLIQTKSTVETHENSPHKLLLLLYYYYCCFCFCSYLLFCNGRTNLPTLKKESASVWKMKKDGIKAANKHKILHIEAVGT